MRQIGIYKIQSNINPTKFYIGSAINISKRRNEHLCRLRKNQHPNNKLQNHFNKYGEEDLVFIIVESCLPEYLIIREQYYIDILKPKFNLRKIANSNLGSKRSEETKLKMRISGIGKNKGRKHTEETKNKIRNSTKGRIRSKETMIKYRQTIINRKNNLT